MAWIQTTIMDITKGSHSLSHYVVLPSNSCPITQPNNRANSFIIDWETPLEFPGDWEAALTEISFNYFLPQPRIYVPTKPEFIFANIDYVIEKRVHLNVIMFQDDKSSLLFKDARDGPEYQKKRDYVNEYITIHRRNDDTIEFISNYHPYTMVFKGDAIKEVNGGSDLSVTVNSEYYVTKPVPSTVKILGGIYISFHNPIKIKKVCEFVNFPINFSNEKLVELIRVNCPQMFSSFSCDETGVFTFSLAESIMEVTFDRKISDRLGLADNHIVNDGKPTSSHSKFTFTQIYVYSSLTEPILVGGVRVPLLRSMWVEALKSTDDIVFESISYPMYLPLSMHTINKVEIELRDDSGRLINFAYGSKSSLTIHFRKNE